MTSHAILGVDPGTRGGLAVLRPDGSVAFLRGLAPEMTVGEVGNAVNAAVTELTRYDRYRCYFEKVGYRPTDGGQGAFTFGRAVGLLEGALDSYAVPVRYVYPMAWQSRLECLTGGNKNVSKRSAQALFPLEKITHAVADALLIARYGWLCTHT